MAYYLDETYWSGNGQYQDLHEKYFEDLVPSFGSAETLEGELLRAINQLIYDHYNNGSCNTRTDHSNTLVALSDRFDPEVVERIELIDDVLTTAERADVGYVDALVDDWEYPSFDESRMREFEQALEDVMDAVLLYIDERRDQLEAMQNLADQSQELDMHE